MLGFYERLTKFLDDFDNKPVRKKYSIVIGSIIVIQSMIIFSLKYSLIDQAYEHKKEMSDLRAAHDEDAAIAAKKLDMCNQEKVLQLVKSEQDFRSLFFKTLEMEDKVKESNYDLNKLVTEENENE